MMRASWVAVALLLAVLAGSRAEQPRPEEQRLAAAREFYRLRDAERERDNRALLRFFEECKRAGVTDARRLLDCVSEKRRAALRS